MNPSAQTSEQPANGGAATNIARPWLADAPQPEPANTPAIEDDNEPYYDEPSAPDVLSVRCPKCHSVTTWPDCESCGFDIAAHRDQQRAADRLALIVPDELRKRRNWLLWKRIPQPGKKDRKVPVYVSGVTRHGEQGSSADRAGLVTFDEARAAAAASTTYAGIGLAMLGDGITALDFDQCIDEGGMIDPSVLALIDGTYAEKSPSGRGVRAFLRGTMPDRKHDAGQSTGIEVFSSKGFVTVTGDVIGAAVDIADLTPERRAAIEARLGRNEAQPSGIVAPAPTTIDPQLVADLRSALNAIPADERGDWVYVGQCLRPLGAVGEELWHTWAQKSDKYNARDAARVWKSLDLDAQHGHLGVFAKAQKLGWVNPAAGASGWRPNLPAANEAEFKFLHARDLLVPTPITWLVHGWIEANTNSLLFGESGGGKSFVAIDIALCVATGTLWHGRGVQRGGVFIVAGEGHGGIKRRLTAWQAHHGISLADAPLFVSEHAAAFIESVGARAVRDAVRKMIDKYGKPALIIVDTLARNIGGGDESSAADIGSFVKSLDLLRNELGCAVLTVHHSGHDNRERARGSSALKAAVDHELRLDVSGETRTLVCTKAKDSEPPAPMAFSLKVVPLEGWPADNDETPTSCVLVSSGAGSVVGASRRLKPLRGASRLAMNELEDAIRDEGGPPPTFVAEHVGHLMAEALRVVHEDVWRQRCYRAGISDGDQDAKQKAFARARTDLLTRGVRCWDGYYWTQAVELT